MPESGHYVFSIPLLGRAAILITIDVGDAQAQIEDIAERARHLQPWYFAVANIARARFRQNFKDAGPGWQPLAPSTIAAKQGANLPGGLRTPKGRIPTRLKQLGTFGAAEILIRTGKMRDALGRRGAPGNITQVTDDGVFVGIDPAVVPYAAVHELGGRGNYTITARYAKALAFMGSHGDMVFRKSVNHPPLPRRPMMTLTADDLDEMQAALADYLLGGTPTKQDE